jgi:anaerobic ribonucleoside-triphosphate reductase
LAATSKADRGLADQLAGNVVDKLVEQGFTSSRAPTVEDIQDIVESTLIDSGNSDIAKAYIVYRHERRKLRENIYSDIFFQTCYVYVNIIVAVSTLLNRILQFFFRIIYTPSSS